VTVAAGSTVIVYVGTVVVAVGAGGFFIISGQIFPIAGGIEAVVKEVPCAMEAVVEEGDCGEVVFNVSPGQAGGAGAAAAEEEEEEEELESSSKISRTSTTFSKSTSTTSSSTSSSATSTPSSYLIFPKDGSNSVANANFKRRLQGLSQPNSISDIPLGNGVAFWTANLTTYNAAKVQEDSYVSIA
jgi:hypothetical protein